MPARAKLTEIIATTFWACWAIGLFMGSVEGLQLIRVQPHIFTVFTASELIMAITRVGLLMAGFFGLAGAVAGAALSLAGRFVRPLGAWPTIFALIIGSTKAAVTFAVVSGRLAMPLVDRLFGPLLRGTLTSTGAHLAIALVAGLTAGLISAFIVSRLLHCRFLVALPKTRTSLITAAVVITLSLPAALADTAAGRAATNKDGDRPNILLIVVDTLRSDRLGCYGYNKTTSPQIDAFAERSILYEHAVVQYPATGPSFGSIFTSKYPRRHGLSAMDPRAWIGGAFNTTLAENLAAAGYTTAAIMTGSITRSSGLARGFQYVFEEHPSYGLHRVDSAFASMRARLALSRALVGHRRRRDPEIVASEAGAWLSTAQPPFFAFVHLFDTHSPYTPSEEFLTAADRAYSGPFKTFTSATLRRIRSGELLLNEDDRLRLGALYDAEVRSADATVGSLLELLERTGLSDNTIVVLTSDHGEELLDHGLVEHGYIYNTNLLVPLMIHFPETDRSSRIKHPVELIDIMPLLLDRAGAPIPGGIDGTKISTVQDPEPGLTLAFAEADCQEFGRASGADCWISVQNGQWKLDKNVTRNSVRLFSLADDPQELNDLASERLDVVSELEPLLDEWHAGQPNLEGLQRELSISGQSEIEERLRALGYIE